MGGVPSFQGYMIYVKVNRLKGIVKILIFPKNGQIYVFIDRKYVLKLITHSF